MTKGYEQDVYRAIAAGLLCLSDYCETKTISFTQDGIMAGDDNLPAELAEVMDYNRWQFNGDCWIFNSAQLEE